MLKVIKRNGSEVDFDKSKIETAILKSMKYGSGIIKEEITKLIAKDVYEKFKDEVAVSISSIESLVYDKLIEYNEKETAKAYEGYRAVQSFKRASNTTDDSILSLIDRQNEDVMQENSNKNPVVIATQRDLIAGEVSKDIARRKLIPSYIVQAHDEGAIHWHDADYSISPMFNCCLINLEDMLTNGTVINDKQV
jgi:ribonucleoside-triphosphate reductase